MAHEADTQLVIDKDEGTFDLTKFVTAARAALDDMADSVLDEDDLRELDEWMNELRDTIHNNS